jgi:hypothetical protein
MKWMALAGWLGFMSVTLGAFLALPPKREWTPSRRWHSERATAKGIETAHWSLNDNYHQVEVLEIHGKSGSTYILNLNNQHATYTVGFYPKLISALQAGEKLSEILVNPNLTI